MNELNTTLNEALKLLLTAVQQASAEIPIIIQEKLLYATVRAGLIVVLLLSITTTFAWLAVWCFKKADAEKKKAHWQGGDWIAGGVTLSLFAALLGGTTLVPIFTIIKIQLAPRLYILDWLKEMIK